MNVIRVKTHLDSETVHLPELRPLVGRDVEIVVWAEREEALEDGAHAPDSVMRERLKGSVLRYDDPFGAAVPPEDWESAS